MKNYKELLKESEAWIKETFEKIDNKMAKVAVRSRNKLPFKSGEDGRHDNHGVEKDVNWWTNGFFGGMNVMLYEHTKNEEYLKTAEANEKLLDGALYNYDKLHHDVGFMWYLLSGAKYRVTGDQNSRRRTLYAASTLASRFVFPGNFIRAWNNWGTNDGNKNWTIIDCMMNLPILYFASRETGDDRFKRIAMAHADNALRTHIRADGSVMHIVEHDRETGDFVKNFGGQGIDVNSSWSRGQAWAVYGFAISYLNTKEERYLDAAKRVANYFIASCAVSDWLPRVDFRQPAEPVYYDSTAGACAACGLIEIAKAVPEFEAGLYLSAAINILKAMSEHFADYTDDTDYILGYGTGSYPTTGDLKRHDVHVPIIYGDYYFVEAILKLLRDEDCFTISI